VLLPVAGGVPDGVPVAVLVGVGESVRVGLPVAESVGVTVAVPLEDDDGEGVTEADGVAVTLVLGVPVRDGDDVEVTEADGVPVMLVLGEPVGDSDDVEVTEVEGVPEALELGVPVDDDDDVDVAVADRVPVPLVLPVPVKVSDAVPEREAVRDAVGDEVAVLLLDADQSLRSASQHTPRFTVASHGKSLSHRKTPHSPRYQGSCLARRPTTTPALSCVCTRGWRRLTTPTLCLAKSPPPRRGRLAR
jgi:hypothetical protein